MLLQYLCLAQNHLGSEGGVLPMSPVSIVYVAPKGSCVVFVCGGSLLSVIGTDPRWLLFCFCFCFVVFYSVVVFAYNVIALTRGDYFIAISVYLSMDICNI